MDSTKKMKNKYFQLATRCKIHTWHLYTWLEKIRKFLKLILNSFNKNIVIILNHILRNQLRKYAKCASIKISYLNKVIDNTISSKPSWALLTFVKFWFTLVELFLHLLNFDLHYVTFIALFTKKYGYILPTASWELQELLKM